MFDETKGPSSISQVFQLLHHIQLIQGLLARARKAVFLN
jgi:hypothetical protein